MNSGPLPPRDIDAEIHDGQVDMTLGNRRYRARGLGKNMSYDQLKVNILLSKGDAVHVDTFDLYNARCRASFVKLAAAEVAVDVEVIKKDVGRVLLKLEELQDQQIADALTPRDRARKLSDRDHDAALELLKDPNLLQRITADFEACGVVGEETNRLAGYLAATSRKLDKPLAVLIQSSSSAGKTSLMDSVLRFMPPEEQVTLLHQYQRPIRTATCGDETIQYIEVTPQDIAVANGLAAEVLGRTLDELSPQARRLLILLHDMVSQKCRELAIDRSSGSPAPTSARSGI
jgi:hypothetical protein